MGSTERGRVALAAGAGVGLTLAAVALWTGLGGLGRPRRGGRTGEQTSWHRVAGWPVFVRSWTGRAPAGRPPVVLVHGAVVSGSYLRPLGAALADDFPVYAPDLPGFGHSPGPRAAMDAEGLADALAAWMGSEGIGGRERSGRGAVVVGNSFGCQIAVELALRHPHRVAGLVLQGPTVDAQARGAVWQAARLARVMPWESPWLNAILLRDALDTGLRRSLGTYRAMLGHHLEQRAPRVSQPVAVVRGERDTVASAEWVERLARRFPAGEVVTVQGAPHAMNYTRPEALAQVVRRFAQKAEPGRVGGTG